MARRTKRSALLNPPMEIPQPHSVCFNGEVRNLPGDRPQVYNHRSDIAESGLWEGLPAIDNLKPCVGKSSSYRLLIPLFGTIGSPRTESPIQLDIVVRTYLLRQESSTGLDDAMQLTYGIRLVTVDNEIKH